MEKCKALKVPPRNCNPWFLGFFYQLQRFRKSSFVLQYLEGALRDSPPQKKGGKRGKGGYKTAVNPWKKKSTFLRCRALLGSPKSRTQQEVRGGAGKEPENLWICRMEGESRAGGTLRAGDIQSCGDTAFQPPGRSKNTQRKANSCSWLGLGRTAPSRARFTHTDIKGDTKG